MTHALGRASVQDADFTPFFLYPRGGGQGRNSTLAILNRLSGVAFAPVQRRWLEAEVGFTVADFDKREQGVCRDFSETQHMMSEAALPIGS